MLLLRVEETEQQALLSEYHFPFPNDPAGIAGISLFDEVKP